MKNMSTQTIEFKNYTTIVSLGERNIYLKFTDQINFVNFEGNVDAKELRLQFDLPDIYKLICDALSEMEGYNVVISINNGFMKLAFHLLVGGFLTVKFEAVLKEKLLSNDGQLTINFNKLEQRYAMLLTKLTQQNEQILSMLEAVSHAEINLSKSAKFVTAALVFPINSKNISLTQDQIYPINYLKIKLLYNLEKLEIGSCPNFTSVSLLGDNKTVKEFTLVNSELETLTGIENLTNLEKITINNCRKVNVSELQNYCQLNKIILNIS